MLAMPTALAADTPTVPGAVHPELWPKLEPPPLASPAVAARVASLVAAMSVEEKVGQIIQADISTITPDDLRTYPLGAVLAGGDSGPGGNDRARPAAWLALADAFYRVSTEKRPGHTPVPVLFGIDAVHGNNNIPGATIFPHNVGLGAARAPDLVRRIGAATADEVAIVGLDWAFAPTLAVARDVRWGRSYESYAEDPAVVSSYAGAMVEGLQGRLGSPDFMTGSHVIASAKHFLGDGGTQDGKDQGDNPASEHDLIAIHGAGYPPAIEASALTVMASFSSWQGVKLVANRGLLTDVLKGREGFEGFVVGDWNAHGQVPGCTKYSCAAAINAGLDMLMAPDSWKQLYRNTLAQVRSGEIPMSRLDDAVRRILLVKAVSGLLDKGRPSGRPRAGKFDELASPAHRAIAREAVRKSLVLLKNEKGLLPLRPGIRLLVAGDGADNVPKQAGGWTISWQGTGNTNADFPQGTSIYAGLKQAVEQGGGTALLSLDGSYNVKPDAAVVVFGEDPYAEFQGDLDTIEFAPADNHALALMQRLKAQGIPVVAVFLSGRPLWVNPELNAADAFVAAWLPGTEGAGIADLLIRAPNGAIRYDFTGKLPFSWPRAATQSPLDQGQPGYDPLFAFGYGLTDRDRVSMPHLPEESGITSATRINHNIYFTAGHAAVPWSLLAVDPDGAEPVNAARQTSPARVVEIRSVDTQSQEDAKSVVWNGSGRGTIAIAGPSVDLRRQSNGDMAIALHLRVDIPPTGPVVWRLRCGKSCGASMDISGLVRDAKPSVWTTLHIKLHCFADAGADLANVERPVEIETAGRFGMTFTDLRLESAAGDATCPS